MTADQMTREQIDALLPRRESAPPPTVEEVWRNPGCTWGEWARVRGLSVRAMRKRGQRLGFSRSSSGVILSGPCIGCGVRVDACTGGRCAGCRYGAPDRGREPWRADYEAGLARALARMEAADHARDARIASRKQQEATDRLRARGRPRKDASHAA
jgi:hypothetical protein